MFKTIVKMYRALVVFILVHNGFASEVESCKSSEECAEDKACFQKLCQDPCLNFCSDEKSLCLVNNHTASCHPYNSTLIRKKRVKAFSFTHYESGFSFTVDGQNYFYRHRDESSFLCNIICINDENPWVIYKLLENGSIGEVTDQGTWKSYYETQFTFTIEKRVFFYGHTSEGNYWFIQELLPSGKMGTQTDTGRWENFYQVCFPYALAAREYRQYFMCYHPQTDYWFIQLLLPGGKMGEEVNNGKFARGVYYHDIFFETQFPFEMHGEQFFFGQSTVNGRWFIRRLPPYDRLGATTDWGDLKIIYDIAFPYTIDGKTYFYGQSFLTHKWSIQELLPGGKLGNVTDQGKWNGYYSLVFPLPFTNKAGGTWFYGVNPDNDYLWFVQELLLGGKMGAVIQSS